MIFRLRYTRPFVKAERNVEVNSTTISFQFTVYLTTRFLKYHRFYYEKHLGTSTVENELFKSRSSHNLVVSSPPGWSIYAVI